MYIFWTVCDLHPVSYPSSHCAGIACQNGGTCHLLKSMAVCNCTDEWNGEFCEHRIPADNPCRGYCKNNAVCHLDATLSIPHCSCIGEWQGEICDKPPHCLQEECGMCRLSSSINECL